MSDPWAILQDETGAAHCRPLFKGERHGHGYTGPIQPHETLIEMPEGEYPDKLALSTQAYRDGRAIALAEAAKPAPTRAEFDDLKRQVEALTRKV